MLHPEPEHVALVTGATRGVGKGVALALADAGFVVYATGRSATQADLGRDIVPVVCDTTDAAAVERVCERISVERGRLDVLVNSAWDAMITVGVRGALVASQYAARLMVSARRGLIVHISSWAARMYAGNVIYGVAKAATDKLAADMAHELAPHGVTVVSMYPGLVRTEAVLAAGVFDLSNSESPNFVGRAIAALAADPEVARRTGQVVVAAALAREYGFTDIDGKQPRPLDLNP